MGSFTAITSGQRKKMITATFVENFSFMSKVDKGPLTHSVSRDVAILVEYLQMDIDRIVIIYNLFIKTMISMFIVE